MKFVKKVYKFCGKTLFDESFSNHKTKGALSINVAKLTFSITSLFLFNENILNPLQFEYKNGVASAFW